MWAQFELFIRRAGLQDQDVMINGRLPWWLALPRWWIKAALKHDALSKKN